MIEAAAERLKIDPDLLTGKLGRLWLYCWKSESSRVSRRKLGDITKINDPELIPTLVDYGFLEDEGELIRVRGTKRYTKMKEARVAGGRARAKQRALEKSKTSVAGPQLQLSSTPAGPQLAGGITDNREPRTELQHPPTPRRRGAKRVKAGRKVALAFGEDGRPIGGERNERVFAFWAHHLRHPDALFDEERDEVIGGAFALGYLEDQLFTAIIGCACSPYHQGKNDDNKVYDSLGLILRNAEKIDDFMARARQAPLTREGYRRSSG